MGYSQNGQGKDGEILYEGRPRTSRVLPKVPFLAMP